MPHLYRDPDLNLEVFQVFEPTAAGEAVPWSIANGWYYWYVQPNDGTIMTIAHGPFESREAALAAARTEADISDLDPDQA